mgnify:CR=1 FL=1
MSDLRDFTGKAEIYGFLKTDADGDGVPNGEDPEPLNPSA